LEIWIPRLIGSGRIEASQVAFSTHQSPVHICASNEHLIRVVSFREKLAISLSVVLSKLEMSLFALISELAPGYRPGRDILVGICRICLDGSPVSMTIKLSTIKQSIINSCNKLSKLPIFFKLTM
jgi:hypothetical protein